MRHGSKQADGKEAETSKGRKAEESCSNVGYRENSWKIQDAS